MPSAQTIRRLLIIVIVLATIGLADAGYLTWQHYQGTIPPCTIHGCETVLTSKYSTIGPVPVSALGTGYYFVVGLLALAALGRPTKQLLKYIRIIIGLGILTTAYLIYLQGFVLHAWCIYCLGSAATTLLLFGVSTSLSFDEQSL